ncbi:GPR1/FUN34/yaaH family-domain-containing protein [Lipomyces oligophaga]|uniref:GPR1/FUN34/yaaH family-domain-containing protein n=1 Tax=Lipomyces oligophaga TaxID=45792 RepID=UPI0034CE93E0
MATYADANQANAYAADRAPSTSSDTAAPLDNPHPTRNADYDLETGSPNKEGLTEEALSRFRTASSVMMTPELFEQLYLSPEKRVKGNLRQTFGNPTPLAVMGHMLCVCPLGCDLIGWRGAGQSGAASTGAYIFIGGLLLFTAGILEFFLGNTFSFVVFCAFGGFWFAFGGTLIPAFNSIGAYSATGDSQVLGLTTKGFQASFAFYLLFWSIAVAVLLLCSLRTNVAFVSLFFCLQLCLLFLTGAYFCLANGQAVVGTRLVKAGGGCALACGLVGFYIYFVLMLLAVDFPFLLPVGDLSHVFKGYQEKHGPLKLQ